MARVDVTPIIPNTTMQAFYVGNTIRSYFITPIEGYVLHHKSYDVEVMDEETGEPTGEVLQGFIPYPASITVGYNYDFTANPSELFAVPADTVPENQIFNNGGNDHEVMNTGENNNAEEA